MKTGQEGPVDSFPAPDELWNMAHEERNKCGNRKRRGTAYNSEYAVPLRFAQIGFRWSPTSGTRETLCQITSFHSCR